MRIFCTQVNIFCARFRCHNTSAGAHKINNAIFQCVLATRIGKKRIVAETGAGQHGVAVATVCAKFNLPCTVYMGAKDVTRQHLNVLRMRMMGATVVGVTEGDQTLASAINEVGDIFGFYFSFFDFLIFLRR